MPSTLNDERYLGGRGFKGFHYLERFRVDNLPNMTYHTIPFTLSEAAMVRIVSTQHKHIEFDMELL
jgi:hypothetical protein